MSAARFLRGAGGGSTGPGALGVLGLLGVRGGVGLLGGPSGRLPAASGAPGAFGAQCTSGLRRTVAVGAAVVAALAGAGCAGPPSAEPKAADEPLLERPAAMQVEGVPALPRRLLAAAQRYGDVAGHQFADWHPTRAEMLVRHRSRTDRSLQLYRVRGPQQAPERLTDGDDPVASATWEPRRGAYVLFARSRGGDEAFQLHRLDPDSGATVQLTPEGQRHAFVDWVRSRGLAVVMSVPLDRTAAQGTRERVDTVLSLVDPERPERSRALAVLPGSGWTRGRVSPDERLLALTRYVSSARAEVWLLDLATGERRRLVPAQGDDAVAAHWVGAWSADGRWLYVLSDRAGEFRELARADPADGTLTRLSAHIAWDVQGAAVTDAGIALAANVDGREELRLVAPTGGRDLPVPALPAGSLSEPVAHPRLPLVAFTASSARGPGQVHVLEVAGAGGARGQAWTQPVLPPGLDLAALTEPEVVRWPSFDGRVISGILHRPAARFAGPRPVLMVMHGGPASQAQARWLGRLNHLTQDLGIAVLEPNVRGSTGYGKTFVTLDDGMRREDAVKDMAAALDWIARQPGLDASRVVVSGGSYGGYMALAAAAQLADRIAGAASTVGISNFVSFLERTESYRRDLRRVEYGDERDPAMRAFLERISPLNQADRITRPLLVAQGRNDPRVPWSESEQIVRRLQARGAPVWYLLADNEGHGFARRENADYHFVAFVRFLEQTLRP